MLSGLENLTSVNLSQNERITNQGARSLTALKNLKALNLSNTRVNAAALRYFGGLVKLQSLALYGCRGIENSNNLALLQNGLPSLKCLRLNTTSNEDGTFVGAVDDEDDDDDFDTLQLTRFAGQLLNNSGNNNNASNTSLNGAQNDEDSASSNADSFMEDQVDDDESFYSDHD